MILFVLKVKKYHNITTNIVSLLVTIGTKRCRGIGHFSRESIVVSTDNSTDRLESISGLSVGDGLLLSIVGSATARGSKQLIQPVGRAYYQLTAEQQTENTDHYHSSHWSDNNQSRKPVEVNSYEYRLTSNRFVGERNRVIQSRLCEKNVTSLVGDSAWSVTLV